MSKTLDKLMDSDKRFDKLARYDKDFSGYHVYLKTEYHVNECHSIWGKTIKDILTQIKGIEKTTWEVD